MFRGFLSLSLLLALAWGAFSAPVVAHAANAGEAVVAHSVPVDCERLVKGDARTSTCRVACIAVQAILSGGELAPLDFADAIFDMPDVQRFYGSAIRPDPRPPRLIALT